MGKDTKFETATTLELITRYGLDENVWKMHGWEFVERNEWVRETPTKRKK